MALSSQYIKVILLFLVLSFANFSDAFPNNSKHYNSDSLEILSLCDSAMDSLADYEAALIFAGKANQIAIKSGCENCIAESEFTLGVVHSQYSDYDIAIAHFEKALILFKANGNTLRITETIDYISTAYIEKFDYGESIKYAQLGLGYSDSAGLNDMQAGFYSQLGYCYEGLGMYKKSADALIAALALFEAEKDSSGIGSCLINLGLIFATNNNYTDAYEYTSRALKICESLDEKSGVSACLNNIGDIYSSLGEYQKALEYFKQSMEIDKELDDTIGIAISLNNIGDSYRDLKDTTLAVSYYFKSIEIGKPNNYPVVAVTLINLGEIYLSQGNYSLALSYALESLESAQSLQAIEQMLNSYNLLHNIYAAMGSYKLAYNYFEKYQKLNDSTYNISKSKSIQEVKSRYDDEKQKSEINILKERSTNESQLRILLFSIISGILLVIIVMLIINVIIRRSRKLVRKQKQYYEKLLDKSEDFVFVIDKNGDTKYISPSYERKIGREIKNRVGKSAFEFIHPDDIENVKRVFMKLVADKQPCNVEFRVNNVAGDWVYMYAYGQNLLDDTLIKGLVINFWDITERKHNEEIIRENEIKFRQIFNAFPDIYFQADMNGKITEVSPSVTKIIGYSRDEIIGANSKEFYNFASDWDKIGAEFEANSYVRDYDTEIITKDGSIIYCSLSAELIFSEDNTGPIAIKGVLHDITGRIKNQQRLRESELRLKEANKSKEKLFSIIAHDLIGPIGTNKSIVDLIVSQVNELSHKEIVKLITSLKPSLDSTYSLVENLLTWAGIQQDRLKPNPEIVQLNQLVGEMVKLLYSQAQRKSISLKVYDDKSITVFADKNQLDIALRNLVSNAIKFSNPGGEVSIYLGCTEDATEIKISDSGVGMNQKQVDNILAGRGSAEISRGTDNEKGTGLGLIIVNEYVKNNNGTLSVRSKEGEGTTFTILLPLDLNPQP